MAKSQLRGLAARARKLGAFRRPGALISLMTFFAAARKWMYARYESVQRRLVPGLQNSQYAYRDKLRSCLQSGVRWLELGCGHQLLPDWMPSADEEQAALLARAGLFVGIDSDLFSLRKHTALQNKVLGDIQRLPFQDSSSDLVTANVVLEHVRDPSSLLAEVHRVLRPGGIFLFHTPNRRGYTTLLARLIPARLKVRLAALLQGRKREDVFPTFYRMNTPRSVRTLAVQSGFQVLELRLTESSAQTVMLGPVVLLELLLIRLLRLGFLRNLQTNIIAVLQKEGSKDQRTEHEFDGERD